MGVLDRLSRCGESMSAAEVSVLVREGVAHFSGVATCGLVWACPVCGATIRNRRSIEVGAALQAALDRGMGLALLTLTVRHHKGQTLRELLRGQERAWRRLQQCRKWRDAAEGLGLVGMITAREITYGGRSGWHPHRHVCLVLQRPLGLGELRQWLDTAWLVWSQKLADEGLTALKEWGIDVRPVFGADAVARYVTLVDEPRPVRAALELIRGDLKAGRAGSVTPEELAEMVTDGEAEAIALWTEYAKETAGRRMLTWTKGLRALLLPDQPVEATDEEVAAEVVGGEVVAKIAPRGWWGVVAAEDGPVRVLGAAERGRDELASVLGTLVSEGDWYLIEGFC